MPKLLTAANEPFLMVSSGVVTWTLPALPSPPAEAKIPPISIPLKVSETPLRNTSVASTLISPALPSIVEAEIKLSITLKLSKFCNSMLPPLPCCVSAVI